MIHEEARRGKALRYALKSWGARGTETPEVHADDVMAVARLFERYLTTGETYDPPTVKPAEPAVWPGPDFPGRPDIAAVITAAVIWADTAHFLNRSGPENWRNWSDTHDQNLINAVAVLTGRPQINVKETP